MIGQYRNVRQACLAEPCHRRTGFGHLHQGKQALLHTSAATGRNTDKWHLLVDGSLYATRKTFADDRTHGATHEFEFKSCRYHRNTLDTALHHNQCIRSEEHTSELQSLMRISY